jgi:pimeloyl-ACP methyl ester carboxylesterase
LRAPNGVLEDSFYQATGRPLWNASSIYVPTLVIAGAYDTWSFPEDREGLIRDLVHTPVKRSVLIPDATHFVLFEKNRFQFASPLLFPLSAIIAVAPIPIPNSSDRSAVRRSRRNRGVGDKKPNSG